MTTLKVQVTWPNAGSELLPDAGADVKLLAGGAALTAVRSARGVRVFDVPDGTTQLELKAAFSASFGAISGKAGPRSQPVTAAAMSAEVLRAEQKYAVAGVQLTAQTIGDFGGPHPLVVTKGAANKNGVVSITLRTEFVDIGAFWEKYAFAWPYFVAEHKGNTTTHVLGCTGGSPLIWICSVPSGLASHGNGSTACLVFFRPANYSYAQLAQPHDGSAVARYFLKPKADGDKAALDFERDHIIDDFNLMRASFEDAIDQSRRAMVMLHPWPSGSSFGDAATGALPSLCEGAIRLLRAKKVVCRGVANVSLGRLGISGFSLGGLGMFASLRANMAKVREVYAFDCVGSEAAAGDIVQWFNSHDSNALRLVGGAYNVSTYSAIKRTISPSGGARRDLTFTPQAADPYAAGKNIVWDHFLSLAEPHRTFADTIHQFAICGGTIPGNGGPYDLDDVETFLANFLTASSFNRL